jgi:hypothetical protein
VNSMSENFYYIADKLDRLKKVDSPTQNDIEEIKEYLAGNEYSRYFFHDLNNPSWIRPLYDLGMFNKVPLPLEDKNQSGYFSMPFWHEGEYLNRMADKFPDIVRDVALSLETDNSRAIRTMLEALRKVPASITTQVVEKFKRWTETPFANFMMLVHELGILMEYLAKGSEVNAALTTLAILLEAVQVKDRFDESKLVASTRHDYYWLNQALQLNLPVLTKIDPSGVAQIAEEQLVKAIELEHDPKVDDNKKKLYSYWRLNISPRSDTNYDNEIKNLLVNTIITAVNEACEQGVQDASIILNRYINSEYSIFRRIGNYVLRTWGQNYLDLLVRAYTRRKEVPIKGGETEFDRLLEIQFKNLQQFMQNEIIHERMTPDLRRVEELLKDIPERYVGETTEEKRQTIIERWQLEDLAPLASYLVGETKEYYEVLQTKYGEPAPRPESGVVVTSWEGPESPIAVEELSKKSVKEVFEYLLAYVSSSAESFGAPSRDGLARTLESDVQGRANDYASNIAVFINNDLPFVYHTHLLRGLENATKNQVKFALAEVVSLCEFITNQDEDKFQKQELEEGLPSAKLAIVNFFEQLFREKDPYIESELLEKFGQIITKLLQQDEPFPYNEEAQVLDPATHSLNCVHGGAMHSLVSYGLYCERKRKKEMGDKGSPVMLPLVKEVLSEKLDKTKDPSLAVHSVFGWYYPQFIYLDKEWAIRNRERIFPVKPELAKFWQAAWNAYIRFSNVYTNVFPEMIKQYQKALRELSTLEMKQGFDRSDEKMASHILRAYLLDLIKLDSEDGLLALYYQTVDDETRSHGNFWLSQVLDVQKPSSQDAVWQKIWDLWQWRMSEAITSNNKEKYMKEIANFCRLLANAPLDLLALDQVIQNTLEFNIGGFEAEEIIKYIGKNAEKFPALAVVLLHKVVISRQDLYLLDESKIAVEKTLVSALEADHDSATKAIEIINIFGERGDYSWRPLLDKFK